MSAAINQLSFSFLLGIEGEDERLYTEWSDEEVSNLMDDMLYRSLSFIRNKSAHSEHFAEEVAWFFDEDNKDHPFSIHNCCLIAGLDVDDLRSGLYYVLPEDKKMIVRLINGSYYKEKQIPMDLEIKKRA